MQRNEKVHDGAVRLTALDGLRGVAAMLVMAYHFAGFWGDAGGDLRIYGALGVELFFIISGFVILLTAERVPTVIAFATARIARLYPAYLFSLLVAGAFLLTIGSNRPEYDVSVEVVAANLTMLQQLTAIPNVLKVYWTLAFELLFYAAIALLMYARMMKYLVEISLFWLAGAIAYRVMKFYSGTLVGLYYDPLFHTLFMPQFGHLFIIGMMLFKIVNGERSIKVLIALSLAVLFSGFGRPDWADIAPLPYLAATILFAVLVYGAATNRLNGLTWAPLASIGVASYSLYLLHVPAWLVAETMVEALGRSVWLTLVIAIPLSFAGAFLSYLYVERGGQMLGRRLVETRRDRPRR